MSSNSPGNPSDLKSSAALAPAQLRWRCDPADLDQPGSAREAVGSDGIIGQQRGVDAIKFGLALERHGFNVFVAGPIGSGRTTAVQKLVASAAAGRPPAPDWCYVNNFEDASQPLAIQLPTGRGPQLVADLDQLIVGFRREIPRVFDGEQYQQQRADLGQQLQNQREQVFEQLRTIAHQLNFEVQPGPTNIATVPLLEPGKPLTQEAFDLLPDEKKAEIRANGQEVARHVDEALIAMRRLERAANEQLAVLDRETMNLAVGHLIDTLRSNYVDQPGVLQHLDRIQLDLGSSVDELRAPEPPDPAQALAAATATNRVYDRYRANPLVSNDPKTGAPVVAEPNPTYYNLIGRVDYRAAMGGMQTDFRLIRAGALHRANGGYLMLQARDVLANPFAWDALKRALRESGLRIENLGEQMGGVPTATLKPLSVPLHVKVILIGDAQTYMALYGADPDFQQLFKIKAEFAPYQRRTPGMIGAYAAFVRGRARDSGLLPFGNDAVASTIEYAARLVEHQERLASYFGNIVDLLTEADQLARGRGVAEVQLEDVEAALAARERRVNLVEEQLQNEIDEGTLAIDTHAEVVGQVNGLSVMELGDYQFARPSRITARVGPGEEGIIDIEREVQLSGPTHSKGILILNGYLLEQYAHQAPLALSARLTFEQVYGPVDGDSASSAELYALLSDLARLPVHQGLAVTGSVNQRGEVQAIGAVTTKVEGFYTVCKAQGLDGAQGVVIPATNVRHLMLKREVVDAVAAGKFHIWAVRHIDEGIEILTGASSERVHRLVTERLRELSNALAEFRERSHAHTKASY